MYEQEARSALDYSEWRILAYYVSLFMSWSITLLVLAYFWGEYLLLGFDDLRAQGTSMSNGLKAVWWIFVWAFAANLIIGVITRHVERPYEPGVTLIRGVWISINSGIFEELSYRWLAFFSAMIINPFFNWITFGLWGKLFREALIPLANWTTFGTLEPYLTGHSNWVLGAAIIIANLGFYEAHRHLGILGLINAWFAGMVMFWLTFNYGIGTAIVVHILYDIVVFASRALTYTWRPEPTMWY